VVIRLLKLFHLDSLYAAAEGCFLYNPTDFWHTETSEELLTTTVIIDPQNNVQL